MSHMRSGNWPGSGLSCAASWLAKAVLNYRRVGVRRSDTQRSSTVRYLGIEVDHAIEIAKKVDI